MTIYEVNREHPQPRRVRHVVDHLREGGLIAYPTDTVHAIGCDVLNKKSVARVYELKGKPTTRPMSLLCADLRHASEYAVIPNPAFRLLRQILPGPYTVILRANERVPKVMLSRRRTVGIRVPAHNVPQAILRELGHPLLTTSCPQFDDEYQHDIREIAARLKGWLAAVVDGGPVPGEPSTVIDLTDDEPSILREGLGDTSLFE